MPIKDMYCILTNEGCDCVVARRTNRKVSLLRPFLARQYYRLINALANIELVDGPAISG